MKQKKGASLRFVNRNGKEVKKKEK